MEFDKTFEESILSQALHDVHYLKRAARILNAHHFHSPQHAWIWKVIRDTWTQFREQATPKLIVARARVDFTDENERQAHLELVHKLYRKKRKTPSSALEQLSNFVRMVNAQLGMERAVAALEKGNLDATYEALRQVTTHEYKPRTYEMVRWIEEFETRQLERKERREHPERYTVVPTGFKRLDSIIGGIQPGELGLVMATTGKGKSIMLTNMAYNSVRLAIPSLYIALEMPARQIAQRQDSRWLRMPYKQIKEYDFTPRELRGIHERWIKINKRWTDMYRIVSMPLRKCNILSVREVLDDLKTEDNFVPKVIFVDSADHMNSIQKYDQYRLSAADVYWELSSLAEEGQYGIWSSTQAGREWAERTATAEASSESYDKTRIADIVISLNTPNRKTRSTRVVTEDDDGEDDRKREMEKLKSMATGDYMEIYLAKYRDGDSKMTIPVDADFRKIYIQEINK